MERVVPVTVAAPKRIKFVHCALTTGLCTHTVLCSWMHITQCSLHDFARNGVGKGGMPDGYTDVSLHFYFHVLLVDCCSHHFLHIACADFAKARAFVVIHI